jgi:hypothetical protein
MSGPAKERTIEDIVQEMLEAIAELVAIIRQGEDAPST